jgi:hypothetical protein
VGPPSGGVAFLRTDEGGVGLQWLEPGGGANGRPLRAPCRRSRGRGGGRGGGPGAGSALPSGQRRRTVNPVGTTVRGSESHCAQPPLALSSAVERLPYEERVVGSIPAAPRSP